VCVCVCVCVWFVVGGKRQQWNILTGSKTSPDIVKKTSFSQSVLCEGKKELDSITIGNR
jgi:hypothetical protein